MSQSRLSFFPNLFFLQCLFSGTSNFVVIHLEGWALLFPLVSSPPHPTPIPIQSLIKFYQFSCLDLEVQLPNSLGPFHLLFNSSYLVLQFCMVIFRALCSMVYEQLSQVKILQVFCFSLFCKRSNGYELKMNITITQKHVCHYNV